MQHDTSYGTAFNTRGNLTTKTQKCYSGTGCAGDAVTKYAYDTAGQVTSMTPPCGNASCSSDIPGAGSFATSYYYADQGANAPGNSDAYVTQIVYPTTNGVSHIENFKYNYTFGDLTSSMDQNKLTTSYQYNDPLDRLTETDGPDGGVTHIAYTGASSILTSQLITSGVAKTRVSTMDGMFHVTKTQLTSDSPCLDTTDTAYDGEGKVLQQSNPHCQNDSGHSIRTIP